MGNPKHNVYTAVVRIVITAVMIGLMFDLACAQVLTTSDSLKTCTLIGCSMPASSIHIRRSNGEIPKFTVGLEYDGRSLSCIPEQSSQLPDRLARNCADSARVIVQSDQEFIGIFGTPTRIKVTLSEQDKIIATREFVPDYKISYPNGIECDPQCKSWSADWSIP